MNNLFYAAGILLITIMLSFIFWKRAGLLVLFWIVVVGAFRKWFFPGLSSVIFFTTHIILLGIYLRFIAVRAYVPRLSSLLVGTIWLYVGLGVLSVFNPRLIALKVGLLGLIIHFYYIPIFLIVPHLFKDRQSFLRYLNYYVLFSLICLILGIVQYFSPVDSAINKYVVETTAESIAKVGERARVTGTFSYISGYAMYLSALALIVMTLLALKRESSWMKAALFVIMVLIVMNLFMTGSRMPVATMIFSIGLQMFFSIRLGVRYAGKTVLILVAMTGAILIAINSVGAMREAYEAFRDRAIESSEFEGLDRIRDNLTPFKFVQQAGLFGYGIGSTYQAVESMSLFWESDMPKDFEEENERILLEVGLLGFLTAYFLRFLLVFYFWRLFQELKNTDLKILALSSLLFQIQFLVYAHLVFNHTSGVLYWFFVGFYHLLKKFDAQEKQERRTQLLARA